MLSFVTLNDLSTFDSLNYLGLILISPICFITYLFFLQTELSLCQIFLNFLQFLLLSFSPPFLQHFDLQILGLLIFEGILLCLDKIDWFLEVVCLQLVHKICMLVQLF